jgi:hypothetical protein
MEKFGRGKDEEEGKIIEDDDDEKTELSKEIYGRVLERTGGIIFWTVCGISYFFLQGWELYRHFETKNIASEQKTTSEGE